MKRLIQAAAVVGLLGGMIFLSGCLTGTIKGQVIDQNDRPVEGAIVTTDPPTHSVRTTENGFRLEEVPLGEYVVEVEKPGFHKGKANVQVSFNKTTASDIQVRRKE